MPSLTSSARPAVLDLGAMLKAVAADPRDEAARLALLDLLQDHAPDLSADLERWDAGTLRPATWNARFLPSYFGRFPPADFHHQFDEQLHRLHTRRGSRLNYIAPRGGAKSTWVTLAYPLRAALEAWEPYTLVLSDSSDQANLLLGHIKKELEENETIREVYPDASGEGPEWNESRIRLNNGVLIEALGTGKKVRGRRNRSDRPSLIVFDDIQSNEDMTSPVKRQRDWAWAMREVIPAGDERTNFLGVGSAIHREAVAVRLGALPGWSGHTFRAVHSWPARMDLWEEFGRLATNLTDRMREATARAFYAWHKAEMDRGAVTYWSERWPLVDLMLLRATIGHSAFETEYQGVPGSPEGAEWGAELFDWNGFWFDDWPEEMAFRLQTLDPSKGVNQKSSDYQAHVMLGLSRDGTFWLDADFRREPGWCGRALDLAANWKPRELVAESNNTMGLMIPEMHRLLAERPPTSYRPLISEVNHGDAKITRMRALTVYLQRRQIRVRNTVGGRMLVEQMRDVPNGAHDDGPDAAATGVLRAEQLFFGT
ncbi:MAG TPA: hypothetical protein VGE74_31525 [Gemmata sp.]